MSHGKQSRREFECCLAVVGLGAVAAGCCAAGTGKDRVIRFGVIADCQYADVPAKGSRYYRESLGKLEACVAALNREPLAFVVNLGDLVDRHAASFDDVLPVLDRCRAPVHHVLGNHDIVSGDRQWTVERLGMPGPYYDFRVGSCRFLILDGNEVSVYGTAPRTPARRTAEERLAALEADGAARARTWNGAVGDAQLQWLRARLRDARAAGEPVVVFCHFPVYPDNVHNLWNCDAVRAAVTESGCVTAFLSGHNHAGLYAESQGVPFLTLPGMVETPDTTAYGSARLGGAGFTLEGVGRMQSYS